jgi:hypothetical protein
MTLLIALSAALAADPEATDPVVAGALVVDARVPVEILVNGAKLASLYAPGESRFQVEVGHHRVSLWTNGKPTDVELDVAEGQEARVLVGRTGVTTSSGPISTPPAADAVAVEFRVVGTPGAQVRVDDGRHAVQSGRTFTLELAPGAHPLSVRSADGTAIWATGTLQVTGSPVVVQIAEGRVPEVSGSGSFSAGG